MPLKECDFIGEFDFSSRIGYAICEFPFSKLAFFHFQSISWEAHSPDIDGMTGLERRPL
jgi:hypothetical protein